MSNKSSKESTGDRAERPPGVFREDMPEIARLMSDLPSPAVMRLIREDIVSFLSDRVCGLGFTKATGLVFTKHLSSAVTARVSIVTSYIHRQTALLVSVCVGVIDYDVLEELRRHCPGVKFSKHRALLISEVGLACPSKRSMWFNYPADTDYPRWCNDVMVALCNFGFSWFDDRSTRDKIIEIMESRSGSWERDQDMYFLPILYTLTGNAELAKQAIAYDISRLSTKFDRRAQVYRQFAAEITQPRPY